MHNTDKDNSYLLVFPSLSFPFSSPLRPVASPSLLITPSYPSSTMSRPPISSLSLSYSSGGSPSSCLHMSARLLLPLTIWTFVSLSLRYGYYGNHHLVLGPNSSRLMKASSVFVEQIQVRGDAKKGFLVYGFMEKPELSLETNWTTANDLFLHPYGRQGFSLWLNKGSRIQMTWKIQNRRRSGDLLVVLVKGESNFETLMKEPTSSHALGIMKRSDGNGEAEYTVTEDDSYSIGVINLNYQSIVMEMRVDLSSKMYDITKAKSHCSTTEGFCRLKLPFPNTQYVVLATPNDNDAGAWYVVELSFVGRLVAYVVVLGLLVLIIFLLFKYIGACDTERAAEEVASETTGTETDPLVSTKEVICLYGATEEDDSEKGLSGSSNDLYDGKICVICYDEQRNSFFVPCGHCATCYACAQSNLTKKGLCRIVQGDNKACPICRRIIHRVRRLHNAK